MPGHTPNRALNRHQLETIAWQVTPESERRGSGSRREVLVKTSQGMTSQPLADMTDNQIRRYIGPKALEEGGDMKHNGKVGKARSRKQLEAILWKTTHPDFRTTIDGERAVLGMGARGGSELVYLSEMSENQLIEKISKTRKGREALEADGYGALPERHTPNASRTSPDETAARELSLYIENDYSLVAAPNSQGKQIEKNLLQKIRNGSFDLEKSEIAWMHLMETGAKQYCKEFGGTWSVMFNQATRELVAHEFATTFYADNKGSR